MKRRFQLIYFFMVLSFSWINAGANTVYIIPKPKSVQTGNGIFSLQRIFRVENSAFKNDYARFLNTAYAEGLDYKCIQSSDKLSEIKIRKSTEKMNAEAYRLTINEDGVSLEASTGAGILYGIQTLKQILVQSWDGKVFQLPFLEIEDEPAFPMRGFMLDASRHFQPVSTVEHVLDYMLSMKLNVFHWHLSDSEGFRVQSLKHPELNAVGSYMNQDNATGTNGYYTVDEIHEIINYANARNIEIIPEIEVPGHANAILQTFPGLRCPYDPKSVAFCAGNPQSLKMITDIFGEVIDIFKPRIIHIGGDERPKGIWEKCELCRAKMKKLGINSEDDLQSEMMVEISKFIHARGVKTMSWAENLDGPLAEGQIIESWRYEGPRAIKKGHAIYNADNGFCYLDYPENKVDAINKPTWMPVLSIEKVYNFNPVPDGLTQEEAKMVLGCECPLWTESITVDKIYPQISGRLEAHAERCWTPGNQKDFTDFSKRLDVLKNYFRFQFYGPEMF